MARSVTVQVYTDHDDTDEALRSVLNGMKRAGYDYVDYKILDKGNGASQSVNGFAHAMLAVAEPDLEKEATGAQAQSDPTT